MASTLREGSSGESDGSINEHQMLALMNNVYQHGEEIMNETMTLSRPLISSKCSSKESLKQLERKPSNVLKLKTLTPVPVILKP